MTASARVACGFIGLGRMGLPMARNLLAAGFPLVVHSRGSGPVDAIVAEGARAAASPAEVAASAAVVVTGLPSEDASRAVFLGRDGLVAHAAAGSLLIDISTVSPELSRETYAAARERGLDFLDAPVSGGPEGARAGTLTIMVGGDRTAFERALPVLRVLGTNIHHAGPSGAGTVVKLVNQLLTGVNAAAAAEAMALGMRAGADPATLMEVIGTSFGDSRMFRRLAPMIAARDFDGGAAIELYIKDLGIITALAERQGTSTPLARAALALGQAARDHGLGRHDIAALVLEAEGTASKA